MKKLIEKYRILVNIWALWRMIRAMQALLDRVEGDIEIMQRKVDMLSSILPTKPKLAGELERLRQEAAVEKETISINRNRIAALYHKLAA